MGDHFLQGGTTFGCQNWSHQTNFGSLIRFGGTNFGKISAKIRLGGTDLGVTGLLIINDISVVSGCYQKYMELSMVMIGIY